MDKVHKPIETIFKKCSNFWYDCQNKYQKNNKKRVELNKEDIFYINKSIEALQDGLNRLKEN